MPERLIDTAKLGEELDAAIKKTIAARGTKLEVTAKAMVVIAWHLAQRIEKRLAALEASPFRYDGPHEGGKEYHKGTFVTLSGSLWHCNYTTDSRPGDGPAWTLAVKKGRDA